MYRGEGLGAPSYDSAPIALSGLPDTSKQALRCTRNRNVVRRRRPRPSCGPPRRDPWEKVSRASTRVHAKYGGIVPGLAKEAHEKAIDAVVEASAGTAINGGYWCGGGDRRAGPRDKPSFCASALEKSAHLAAKYEKPFLHCHHLEAHCLVARLRRTIGVPLPRSVSVRRALPAALGARRRRLLRARRDPRRCSRTYSPDKAARMLRLSSATGGGPALEQQRLCGATPSRSSYQSR